MEVSELTRTERTLVYRHLKMGKHKSDELEAAEDIWLKVFSVQIKHTTAATFGAVPFRD